MDERDKDLHRLLFSLLLVELRRDNTEGWLSFDDLVKNAYEEATAAEAGYARLQKAEQ